MSTRGVDPLVAFLVLPPLFFAVGVGVQWVMERFRVMPFNSLLITFGLMIIIEAVLQLIWTADYRRLESAYAEHKFRVAGLFLPLPEVITLILSASIALAVWFVLRRSDIGKAIRAAAEDAPIAAAFGINTESLGAGTRWPQRCVGGGGGRVHRVSLHVGSGADLCLDRRGVRLRDAWRTRPSAVISYPAGCAIGIVEAITMTVTSPSWAPLVSFSLLLIVLVARPGRA